MQDKRIPIKVGRKIKAAREDKGLKQEDLAKMTGISRAQISQWESLIRNPMENNFNRIAEALEMSPSELMNYKTDSGFLPDEAFPLTPEDSRRLKIELLNVLFLGLSEAGLDEALRIITDLTKDERFSRKPGENE